MQIVRAVPDQSMMISGKELRTFECLRCRRREERIVFTRFIEQLPAEPMQVPELKLGTWAERDLSGTVRNAWLRAVSMLRRAPQRAVGWTERQRSPSRDSMH